jgi:Tfp pilus assembly protein PilW
MIAMAAGMVVLTASLQMLDHFQQRLWAQHDTIALHQDQRIGMRILAEELRIAGSNRNESPVGLLQAKPQEIEFHANVGGATTSLTKPVSLSDSELFVIDGAGWTKGKRILICASEYCAESRLAEDGQRRSLSLAIPIPQGFPAGSEVSVFNHVPYYVSKGRKSS